MGIIKDYMENAGGNFLNAQNCQDRATVTVTTLKLDDETFDKPYIVITGTYDPTGIECNVRLGIQNVNQIAKDLGEDETTWIGKKIEMIGTREYKGLGKTGLLWRGVKTVGKAHPLKQTSMPQTNTVEATIAKVLIKIPTLTKEKVQEMIQTEIDLTNGTISEETAAYMVSHNLGVK